MASERFEAEAAGILCGVGAAGVDGIPEGHLYAMMMGQGMTLSRFGAVVEVLRHHGLLRFKGRNLLELTAQGKALVASVEKVVQS